MSDKIIAAEVSDNTVWYGFFPYAANTWIVQIDNDYSTFASSAFGLEDIELLNHLNIISFLVKKIPYTRVDTIAEVITIESSFYYDSETKTLLIHFENHNPYYFYEDEDIEIGFALTFYHSLSKIDGIFDNVQYDPRLLSTPSLKETKDDLFNAKQKLQSGSIEFENYDLKYKNFNIGANVKKKNGNFVRTLLWTGVDASIAQYEDFNITYQGVIEKIVEGKTIKIDLRDIRSTLGTKSPQRYLDTSTFSDLEDQDKEYLLNELWGKCYKVPCICLNPKVNDGGGSSNYQFILCDVQHHDVATNSINAVYINDTFVSGLTPSILINTFQNFAYFEIASTNFLVEDRYEGMNNILVDAYGYLKGINFIEANGDTFGDTGFDSTELIENGMAIIREIIKNNYNYTYTSTFYDLDIWQSFEESSNTYDIGYFLNKQKTVQKQIEEIAGSMLGSFIWNTELKFTWDNDDYSGESDIVMEIPKHNFYPIDYFPVFNQDSKKVIATLRVGTKKQWDIKDSELKYNWIINETNKQTALIDYATTKTKDFPTLINNDIDGEHYSNRAISFIGTSEDTFTIKTDWSANTLKPGDWIKVQADHIDEILIGWVRCQVLEKNPIIKDWMVDLKLRIFGYEIHITNQLEFDYYFGDGTLGSGTGTTDGGWDLVGGVPDTVTIPSETVIVLGAGTYNLKTAVILSDNVSIVGDGKIATTTILKNASGVKFKVTSNISDVSLTEFIFDGQADTITEAEHGGALSITASLSNSNFDCNFKDHNLAGSKNGGAIYSSNVTNTSNCSFTDINNCNAENGAAYNCDNSIIKATGCSALTDGGGTYNCNNSTITATNCTSTSGGGAFDCDNSTITANNCSASNYGGGAYDCDNSVITANYCSAADNREGGGAYGCDNSTITANYCFAGSGGGAFYCLSSTITATNCSAGYGGAADDCGYSTITANNCTADNDGGGTYSCNNSTITATNCSAVNYGGGAYNCDNSTITANNCTADNDGGGAYNCDNITFINDWKDNTANNDGDVWYNCTGTVSNLTHGTTGSPEGPYTGTIVDNILDIGEGDPT